MNELEYVVKNSEHVKINFDKLISLSNKIGKLKYSHWSKKNNLNMLTEKQRILFVFVLESINFCFWPNYMWKAIYEGNEYFGSDALLYSLLIKLKNDKNFLNLEEMFKLEKKEFYEIFKFNNILPPLIDGRYKSFKNTINTINKKGEKFFNEIFKIKSAYELENYISKNFELYDDKSLYKGKIIHFNKRIRLLIKDLCSISPEINKNINDLNKLKGCADYSLPRFFREEGMLIYDEKLSYMVDNGIELAHNSNEEIEIRACTLYLIEKIKEEIKDHNINSIELDNIIWKLSRKKKKSLPHYTISIYY